MNQWLLSILVGLALLLATSPIMAAPESQVAEGDIYIVQANDWLSKLADKYYADLSAFPTIVEATNAMAAQDASFTPILDPDHIEVGQKLWIPASPTLLSEGEAQSDDTLPQVALLPATAETVAFSPDDSLLALGNYQQAIQVWETSTWSLLWEAQHDDPVRQVVFSPDGQLLASAGYDNIARLWQAQTGEEVSHLTFDFRVYGLYLDADGQFLVTGSRNGQSLLLDATTGQTVIEFKPQFPVYDLALSPNAPWLAVFSAGKWGPVELAVWDIFTQESRVLAQVDGPPSNSNAVFSPDAKWLAASVQSGQPITVWETLIWPEAAHLEKPAGVVHQLAFSPDGTRLAARISGGDDIRSTVWVWSVPDWQLISTMDQPDMSFAMAFSPDSQFLATGLGQGIEYEPAYEAQLWDVTTGQRIARMPHDSQVLTVAFSHDGRWIATGSPDGTTRIWAMPPR